MSKLTPRPTNRMKTSALSTSPLSDRMSLSCPVQRCFFYQNELLKNALSVNVVRITCKLR